MQALCSETETNKMAMLKRHPADEDLHTDHYSLTCAANALNAHEQVPCEACGPPTTVCLSEGCHQNVLKEHAVNIVSPALSWPTAISG